MSNQYSQDANLAFEWQWDNIAVEVPFNPKWANGTGYMDHAVYGEHAPFVTPGTVVKSTDNHGRKIMIVGLTNRLGNVVIFERYRPDTENPGNRSPITHNSPRLLKYVLSNNVLTADEIRSAWDQTNSDLYDMAAGFERLYGSLWILE